MTLLLGAVERLLRRSWTEQWEKRGSSLCRQGDEKPELKFGSMGACNRGISAHMAPPLPNFPKHSSSLPLLGYSIFFSPSPCLVIVSSLHTWSLTNQPTSSLFSPPSQVLTQPRRNISVSILQHDFCNPASSMVVQNTCIISHN